MARKLVELLNDLDYKISTVESVTGGSIASKITDVIGSGRCFFASLVVYADVAKAKLLGVKPVNIYSRSFVRKMALAGMKKLGSDVVVSICGHAGPTEMQVGSVYVAVAVKAVKTVYSVQTILRVKDRNKQKKRISIKSAAVLFAIRYVYKTLRLLLKNGRIEGRGKSCVGLE